MSKKPSNQWDKEKAENRFVQGDRITLKDLAKLTGLPLGNIRMWCNKEGWVAKREEYQISLRSAVQQKTIEKTSERLSDEFSEISSINYKAHRLARDYVTSILQIKARHMQLIQHMNFEEQLQAIKSHNAHEMNFWSLMLARATEGIAAATGLSYHVDVNAAARRVEKEGLVISDPTSYEMEGEEE